MLLRQLKTVPALIVQSFRTWLLAQSQLTTRIVEDLCFPMIAAAWDGQADGLSFAYRKADIDACRDDEILVEIVAVGICHTDLAIRDGDFPIPPMPVVLGHEGAGRVVRVGNAVTKVVPGDHVILSFASCGNCRACQEHMPHDVRRSYC